MDEAPVQFERVTVKAVVVEGSDYPGVWRIGASVDFEREDVSGRVVVTRARGSVKLAYVIGSDTHVIPPLHVDARVKGKIVDVSLELGRKTLVIELVPAPK